MRQSSIVSLCTSILIFVFIFIYLKYNYSSEFLAMIWNDYLELRMKKRKEEFLKNLPENFPYLTGNNFFSFFFFFISFFKFCSSTITGAVRYCDKCQHVKPDRAHHCSVCGQCVLKMDHHCPWVNNCVNFTNYKYFILFLGYALFYCLYIGLTSVEFFVKFWKVSFHKI